MYALALTCGLSAAMCAGASAQIGSKPRPPIGPQLPSSLPPTPPTTAPQTAPQTAPLTATPTQPITRAHRAAVVYDSGLVSINANNSSLNQILREISKQTGMKITGGVREERVFGHYGPASLADILNTLIDGTNTNMVLRQTASNTPEELILTPRSGGATPPNPNAPSFDDSGSSDDDDREPQRANPPPNTVRFLGVTQPAQTPNPISGPISIPPPANNVNGSPNNTSPTASTLPVTNSVPIDTIPTPSTTPPANGIVDAPNPPDPGTVNPANPTGPTTPNGVKTPEDIYKQLQQLRQQQQQQQQPASTTPTQPTTPQ
jgi:hypothetical protein